MHEPAQQWQGPFASAMSPKCQKKGTAFWGYIIKAHGFVAFPVYFDMYTQHVHNV